MHLKGELIPEARAILKAAEAKHRDYICNLWKYEVAPDGGRCTSSRKFWNRQIKATYRKLELVGADTGEDAKTISAANKAWLKEYCQDRAKAAAAFDSKQLAKVFEVFFYLGCLCQTSVTHSLPKEINRVLGGRDVTSVLGTGSAP